MSRVSPKKASESLFHVRFESSPKPINCTTFLSTTTIIQDDRHPLHIPILRRIEDWNPKTLDWAVRAPIAISKKRTVRSWASRRFRDAFIAELNRNGFTKTGDSLAKDRPPLTGALSITLLQPILTAPIEDVREACKAIFRKNLVGRMRS